MSPPLQRIQFKIEEYKYQKQGYLYIFYVCCVYRNFSTKKLILCSTLQIPKPNRKPTNPPCYPPSLAISDIKIFNDNAIEIHKKIDIHGNINCWKTF